jgi:riboflavin biosynthesis pyrimidine reductase
MLNTSFDWNGAREPYILATENDVLNGMGMLFMKLLTNKAQIFADGAPNKTLVFDDAVKAIKELGKAGITSVLCEGGLDLARSLAQEGLVDEWHTILSPIVMGARPISKAMRFSNGACGMSDVAVGDVHAFSSASGKVFL